MSFLNIAKNASCERETKGYMKMKKKKKKCPVNTGKFIWWVGKSPQKWVLESDVVKRYSPWLQEDYRHKV